MDRGLFLELIIIFLFILLLFLSIYTFYLYFLLTEAWEKAVDFEENIKDIKRTLERKPFGLLDLFLSTLILIAVMRVSVFCVIFCYKSFYPRRAFMLDYFIEFCKSFF